MTIHLDLVKTKDGTSICPSCKKYLHELKLLGFKPQYGCPLCNEKIEVIIIEDEYTNEEMK